MNDQNDNRPDEGLPETPAEGTPPGERIAKVIARAGLASRRVAEKMILAGRVTVNGEKITSPALDVQPHDRITVDDRPLDEPQPARLWLYYKPVGLVTTESDEMGRRTIYDELPDDLPRVITVGRLDLNSEGLLLLTNDGELKRRLELPSTGWLRRYRVRVNGRPTNATFDVLRRGVTIDGEEFQPMDVTLDSSRGDNAWLTVGIREGRNREVRRLMAHVGLIVNRLIRLNYGPFRLTGMKLGEVKEIRRRVLRDQLGALMPGNEDAEEPGAGAEGGPRHGHRHAPRADGRPPRPQTRPQGARREGHGGQGTASGGERGRRPASGPSGRGSDHASRRPETRMHDGDGGRGAPRKARHKGGFGASGGDRDRSGGPRPAADGDRSARSGFRQDRPRDGQRRDGPRRDGPRRDGPRGDAGDRQAAPTSRGRGRAEGKSWGHAASPARHSGPDRSGAGKPAAGGGPRSGRAGKPGEASERKSFTPRKGPGKGPGRWPEGNRGADGKGPRMGGASGRKGPPSGPRGPRSGPNRSGPKSPPRKG